jgi:imidazole glycerol phosphate synthase subunit HisF
MATAETKALIEQAVATFRKEVPALDKLKLVVELELRGRGDIQLFRVELPGPKVTKDIASDAKVRLSVPRADFNELAREGTIRHWREAFESGHVRATGPPEILKLIASVVEKQEERTRTRKLRVRSSS